jgi:hypothetical protein
MQTDGRIHEVRRRDGLRYHDIHTKFHEDLFIGEDGDTKTYRQHGDRISLLHFLLSKPGYTAEHGGNRFLRNFSNHLPNCTAPHPRETFNLNHIRSLRFTSVPPTKYRNNAPALA